MKKFIKALVVASIFTLMLGGSALAGTFTGGNHASYNGGARLHGDFGTNTAGCAGCHVTHSAAAKKLLKFGPTQTAFCFNCHGGFAGSPYDVENGKIQPDTNTDTTWLSGVTNDSYAGGFGGDALGNAGTLFTSVHNVESTTSESIVTKAIPGSDNQIYSGLKCASCHNPHRGGLEARLLRTDLPASAAGTTGTVTVSAPTMSIDATSNLPTSYDSGFSNWCGGCHNRFNKADNSGHNKGADTMYRHAMGVIPPDSITDTSLANGTPLEGGKVSCLTCHRAHGSKATVSGEAASFISDSADGTHSGSALLRMNNRDVCYNCHGAAERNTTNGTY